MTAGTERTAWGAPLTLATMAMKKPYWSQVLADRGALFVQYNACVDAQPPWADFVAEVGRTLDQQKLKRLVIDLRFNGGGDETRALVGEIMKNIAEWRGAAGYVIDGAIRDVAAFAASRHANAAYQFILQKAGVTPQGDEAAA